MSINDLMLLDKIISDVQAGTKKSYTIGEFFEIFCTEQILKNYDLSLEEIESGITDGSNDGGIDGLYIFVNGNLLNDIKDIKYYKKDVSLEIIIITSKHDAHFEQVVINSEYSTIDELLDFAKDEKDLVGIYNERLIEKRNILINCYMQFATKIRNFSIKFLYVSRGDSKLVGDNVKQKAIQLQELVENYFSNSIVEYSFIGASELLELYRKQREFNLDLPFCEQLSADNQKYIVLCNLKDYFNFLRDDKGELKRYLFDSNVRDYNGLSKTNLDILNTLNSETFEDFWWLNNGITILSSNAINMGKVIRIENVQIVNGLQTSYTIYEYFNKNLEKEDNRKLMVKIITETDKEIRDKIIRATNNQTSIQEASLHATDKVQRDIEDILLKNGMYYERRTNFYLNQGVLEENIFSPLYLAAGFVSLIDKNIIEAIGLKQKFMQNKVTYESIYVKTPLDFWPKIAKIQRNVDTVVIKNKKEKGLSYSEGYLKVLRHIVSFLTLSYHFGKYDYNHKNFADLTMDAIDKLEYEKILNKLIEKHPKFEKRVWRSKDFINNLIEDFAIDMNIKNPQCIIRKRIKHIPVQNCKKILYDKELFERVKNEIPSQPWEKGMHSTVAEKLNMASQDVSAIINFYIEQGVFYYQMNGKLYDKNWNLIIK